MKDKKEMFGDRLKSLREKHGYSQEHLARTLNKDKHSEVFELTADTVDSFERAGGSNLPGYGVVLAICRLFDTTIDYLCFGDGHKFTPFQIASLSSPSPGELWRHFSGGGIVEILTITYDSESGEPRVVYRHLGDNRCFDHTLGNFLKLTERGVRFSRIEDEEKDD